MTLVQIKMLVSIAGERVAVMPGQVVDWDDEEAKRFIERGIAEPAEPVNGRPETASRKKPRTAVKPKAEGK